METSDNLIGRKIIKEQWKGKVTRGHKTTTTLPSGLRWKELVEEAEKIGTIIQGLHRGCQGHDAKTLTEI
eukprot:7637266-Ditylum_brightwellii.AAC.1